MSSSSKKTRIFVKQDLQQLGRVCRVDLQQPMASILAEISQQIPPPPSQRYVKLLLIDENNQADFEVVQGSDIERGDKLLLQCGASRWGQQPVAPAAAAPAAAAGVPLQPPSPVASLVTPSASRGGSAAKGGRNKSKESLTKKNSTTKRRRFAQPRPKTRKVISKISLAEKHRKPLSNQPFSSRTFCAYCKEFVSDSVAESYTLAAEMLFRNEEYRAKHWTCHEYFLADEQVTLASDFVALYQKLVAMEEDYRIIGKNPGCTTMRGALTYLDDYQRKLLGRS